MVIYVMKYDILPDKAEAYARWAAESTIPRILKIPGLVEFRGYRPATGSHQIAVTYEFKNMASWAAWMEDPDYRKMMDEAQGFTTNWSVEVWGPSPVVPEPLKP